MCMYMKQVDCNEVLAADSLLIPSASWPLETFLLTPCYALTHHMYVCVYMYSVDLGRPGETSNDLGRPGTAWDDPGRFGAVYEELENLDSDANDTGEAVHCRNAHHSTICGGVAPKQSKETSSLGPLVSCHMFEHDRVNSSSGFV